MRNTLMFFIFMWIAVPMYQNTGTAKSRTADYIPDSSVQIISADFLQIRTIHDLNIKIEFKGKMLYERGGRLLWTVNSPVKNSTLIDKENLKHYDAECGKITVMSYSAFPWMQFLRECLTGFLTGNVTQLNTHFTITYPGKNVVFLKPIDETAKTFCTDVEISFGEKDHLVKTVKIKERGSDTLELIFSNSVCNPVLLPDVWEKDFRIKQ